MVIPAQKLVIYLIAFAITFLLHLNMHEVVGFSAQVLLGALAAVAVFSVIRLETKNLIAYRNFTQSLVLTVIAITIIFPLLERFSTDEQSFAHIIITTLFWPQMLVSFFGGLAIINILALQKDDQRANSITAHLAFGVGFCMAFYAGLVWLFDLQNYELPAGVLGAFLGDTVLHYLIVFLFFTIFSYILQAIITVVSKSKQLAAEDTAPQYISQIDPFELALRRFVRVMIGFLPLLGFLGTVLGIMKALRGLPHLFSNEASQITDISQALSGSLSNVSLAFETTMLGIIASMISSLALSYTEKMETDLITRVSLMAGKSNAER